MLTCSRFYTRRQTQGNKHRHKQTCLEFPQQVGFNIHLVKACENFGKTSIQSCAMDFDEGLPFAKKRRGGLQQRLGAQRREEEATGVTVDQPSLLAEWLKEQWAWGKMSPQLVQHVAALAKRDMVAANATNIPEDLHKLSMLGTEGAHANNCHRDLQALVANVSKLPEPLQVFLPMKLKGNQALQSIMLPHMVMHHVWVHYQSYWQNFFLAQWNKWPASILERVPAPPINATPLAEAPGVDHCAIHPCQFLQERKTVKHVLWPAVCVFGQDNWMASCIPINLHGDSVPTVGCGKVWSKLMQCYSWAGLLTVGSTKERSFFIYGAPGHSNFGLLLAI